MTPLLFLVGPTASGKTALAVELCRALNGEIVSMDSMQIYRTLDIGTGKPTREEQNTARHHLLDIIPPNEIFSAAQWAKLARKAIDEIRGRGKTPIVAGGTGFYARALLQRETLASAPPNLALRAHLETQLQNDGADALHDQLRVLDSAAAARLSINDTRRVMRAIEVALFQSAESAAPIRQSSFDSCQSLIFGLEWPREKLYRRIETRIDAMLQMGFMDELRHLTELDLGQNATAIHSLGYKQMRPALDDARVFAECLELWKRDTRRYAKRQMTWFRHQLPTRWLEMDDATPIEKLAEKVAFEYSISKSV